MGKNEDDDEDDDVARPPNPPRHPPPFPITPLPPAAVVVFFFFVARRTPPHLRRSSLLLPSLAVPFFPDLKCTYEKNPITAIVIPPTCMDVIADPNRRDATNTAKTLRTQLSAAWCTTDTRVRTYVLARLYDAKATPFARERRAYSVVGDHDDDDDDDGHDEDDATSTSRPRESLVTIPTAPPPSPPPPPPKQ